MNYLSAMHDANIPWHNPDHLTPAQVDPKEEGWRLLLREEIDPWRQISREIEKWRANHWDNSRWSGGSHPFTYRTKWPLPAKYHPSEGFPPGLPPLPEPPAGHRWVYRGTGWENNYKPARYIHWASPWTTWNDSKLKYGAVPAGCESLHYAEAVPLTTQSQPQTTMNKIPYINTENQPELFEMICQLGEKLGGFLTSNLELRNNRGAIAFEPLPAHPLHLDGSRLSHWRENPDRSEEVSVQTFVELMRKVARKEESVKLNDKHTAIVTKDGVKVGCQDFPLSVIDDLVEAKRRVLE